MVNIWVSSLKTPETTLLGEMEPLCLKSQVAKIQQNLNTHKLIIIIISRDITKYTRNLCLNLFGLLTIA